MPRYIYLGIEIHSNTYMGSKTEGGLAWLANWLAGYGFELFFLSSGGIKALN